MLARKTRIAGSGSVAHGSFSTSIRSLQLFLACIFGVYVGINISELFSTDRQHYINNNGSKINKSGNNITASTGMILGGFVSSKKHDQTNTDDDRQIRKELENARALIRQLQADTKKLHKDQLASVLELDNKLETSLFYGGTGRGSKISNRNRHPLCRSVLSHPTPSATSLWSEHIQKILDSSRVPNDKRYFFHDFTTQLLQIISPRLSRSIKTGPYDWRPVGSCLSVAWERYKYLQLPEKERQSIPESGRPRPLKILVMGGSLLVGTNCRMLMREMNFQFQLPKRECNWSNRVAWFLNAFFLGYDVFDKRSSRYNELLVEVTKVAMGGTNTGVGEFILQYDLIPENARDPDVIINAYSTNDMHILTVLEAQSSNSTLRDRTFDMIQRFVRRVLGTKRCGGKYSYDNEKENSNNNDHAPPLLLHMDDYLGNEQTKIFDTTELAQGVQVLASYYGFVSMSYADTVREFVYGDAYEKWFSSEWFVPKINKGQKQSEPKYTFERQIHPGMGAHISMLWVTAYNLVHLASEYCSMPSIKFQNNITSYDGSSWNLPELKKDFKEPIGKPKQQPNVIPPLLTKDLLLEDMTKLWRGALSNYQSDQLQQSYSVCSAKTNTQQGNYTNHQVICPFSWVSGLSLQQNNVTWIEDYFRSRSSVWENWKLSTDGDKIGFVPTPATKKDTEDIDFSQEFILNFSYSQTIRSITIFFMKSYGSKWVNSELSTKIWLTSSSSPNRQLLEERRMAGTHNKNTSEMYTEEIILQEPINANENFQIDASLVGGTTFKIMGIAVCS